MFKLGAVKTFLVLLALGASLCAQAAAPAERYQRVTVHGPTLVGNLDGDSPDRPVSVWLPPGYAKNKKQRYPVLYLLHGFTDSDTRWFGREGEHFVHVPNAVDASYANGVKEMIVVMPNAFTRFQGSMYGNSVATGDWETFISRDLVAWIDAHYRTLATPASRGLAGHSMGGYGTLRVAMKAPGIFSSLYIMSPCCLQPGPPPDPKMFEAVARIRTAEEISAADFFTKAMLASAAAWSPNPAKPPLYLDFPVADGKVVPEVVARWAANAPVIMLHQYVPALKTYGAIGLESGDKDFVATEGSKRLHELLDGYSIKHDFELYQGDHVNRIHDRLITKLMPFFDTHLKRTAP
jgi:S-formylglutathione hydrolase